MTRRQQALAGREEPEIQFKPQLKALVSGPRPSTHLLKREHLQASQASQRLWPELLREIGQTAIRHDVILLVVTARIFFTYCRVMLASNRGLASASEAADAQSFFNFMCVASFGFIAYLLYASDYVQTPATIPLELRQGSLRILSGADKTPDADPESYDHHAYFQRMRAARLSQLQEAKRTKSFLFLPLMMETAFSLSISKFNGIFSIIPVLSALYAMSKLGSWLQLDTAGEMHQAREANREKLQNFAGSLNAESWLGERVPGPVLVLDAGEAMDARVRAPALKKRNKRESVAAKPKLDDALVIKFHARLPAVRLHFLSRLFQRHLPRGLVITSMRLPRGGLQLLLMGAEKISAACIRKMQQEVATYLRSCQQYEEGLVKLQSLSIPGSRLWRLSMKGNDVGYRLSQGNPYFWRRLAMPGFQVTISLDGVRLYVDDGLTDQHIAEIQAAYQVYQQEVRSSRLRDSEVDEGLASVSMLRHVKADARAAVPVDTLAPRQRRQVTVAQKFRVGLTRYVVPALFEPKAVSKTPLCWQPTATGRGFPAYDSESDNGLVQAVRTRANLHLYALIDLPEREMLKLSGRQLEALMDRFLQGGLAQLVSPKARTGIVHHAESGEYYIKCLGDLGDIRLHGRVLARSTTDTRAQLVVFDRVYTKHRDHEKALANPKLRSAVMR